MKNINQKNPAVEPWWLNTVFYELYVDKFAGTFSGLAGRLDYLKELGIGCLHLLPHYPSPMIDDGYDVSDYLNVRGELGTLKDFETMVNQAHAKKIRVMLDLVLNHVSVEHPWFKAARSSAKNSKRDYFLWSRTGKELAQAANPFSDLKPSNWTFNPGTKDYYFSTFYPEQADLNWDNGEVFEAIMAVIDFWQNLGVDAFRLDAVAHLIKREGTASKSLPETHAVLKKIRSHIDTSNPQVALLAEVNEPVEKLRKYFGEGDECQLVYNFPLTGQMMLALKRNDPALIKKIIENNSPLPKSCQWVTFLRSHDELSLRTLSPKKREEINNFFDANGKHRFKTGLSLRLSDMLNSDKEKISRAFRMLFSVPGSPVIYYGDEIGASFQPIPKDEKDTRKGLRGAFDWQLAEAERKKSDSIYGALAKMIRERKQIN